MSFAFLSFGQFCPRFVFPHLDPKGLKTCHFRPLVNSIHLSPLSQGYFSLFC
ncbi:hypothetical protein Hanom_Chr01g00035141 [Helianthus anomalus]